MDLTTYRAMRWGQVIFAVMHLFVYKQKPVYIAPKRLSKLHRYQGGHLYLESKNEKVAVPFHNGVGANTV